MRRTWCHTALTFSHALCHTEINRRQRDICLCLASWEPIEQKVQEGGSSHAFQVASLWSDGNMNRSICFQKIHALERQMLSEVEKSHVTIPRPVPQETQDDVPVHKPIKYSSPLYPGSSNCTQCHSMSPNLGITVIGSG